MNKYSQNFNTRLFMAHTRRVLYRDIVTSIWAMPIFILVIPVSLYWILEGVMSPNNVFELILLVVTLSGCLWIILATIHIVILSIYNNIGYSEGVNDNKKSIELTAKVVKESKKWVIFYDYGENDVYNIYNNSEIINSLISKLEGKELFEVSLIFSKPEEDVAKLPLVKELLKWRDKNKKSQNKVFIIMGQEELSNEHEYHYKINDTGSAFITKHSPGENNREFKFFTPDAIRPVKKIDECLYFHNESDSKKAA